MPKNLTELISAHAVDINGLTITEARKVIDGMKSSSSLQLGSKLKRIVVDAGIADSVVFDSVVRGYAQDFLSYIPDKYSSDLAPFEIRIVPVAGTTLGSYNRLSKTVTVVATQHAEVLKCAVFHELAHWLHFGGRKSFQNYQDQIETHFSARTAKHKTRQLQGYGAGIVGKADRFWDPYMGREYPVIGGGSEIPSMAFELLNKPFEFAMKWNSLTHRETLDIVFSVLFP